MTDNASLKSAQVIFGIAGVAAAHLSGDVPRLGQVEAIYGPFQNLQGAVPKTNEELTDAIVQALNHPSKPPLADFITAIGNQARSGNPPLSSTDPDVVLLHHLYEVSYKQLASAPIPVSIRNALRTATAAVDRQYLRDLPGDPVYSFAVATRLARALGDGANDVEVRLPDRTVATDAEHAIAVWMAEGGDGMVDEIRRAVVVGGHPMLDVLHTIRDVVAPGTPSRALMEWSAGSKAVLNELDGLVGIDRELAS